MRKRAGRLGFRPPRSHPVPFAGSSRPALWGGPGLRSVTLRGLGGSSGATASGSAFALFPGEGANSKLLQPELIETTFLPVTNGEEKDDWIEINATREEG